MIKKIVNSEFFQASFWIFLSTGVINVGNYLYHLIMGRMLGPETYGLLESVISLFVILAIPFSPLTLVIVKFISVYKGKNDSLSISSLYFYFRQKLFIWGLITSVVLILSSSLIMTFLHIKDLRFPLLISLTFFIGLFSILLKSMLQGLFKFSGLFFSNAIEIVVKVSTAILLVVFGFKALGAFSSIALGTVFGITTALYFLRKEKFVNSKKFLESKEIFKYSIPVFITTFGLTSLFTTDVVLVRNLFSAVDSGFYAALSVLGKIIFFATFPITMVLFPLVSRRHSSGEHYKHLLSIALLLNLSLAGVIVLVYFLFPTLMVNLLFGPKFLSVTPLLGLFGVFIAIYSFCSLLANFYLSVHKSKVSVLVFLASISQVILIYLFHSNLSQVITMSIIVNLALLASLLLYYPFAKIGKKI